MTDKSNLQKLKKNYEVIQKKYDLPSFQELNEDFQIEKVAETETDILIREVRRLVSDKLANYLRFTEALLHPINAPLFVFSIIKTINLEQKKILIEVYKELAKNEVRLIEIDLKFSEEKEAEFVKESYKIWQEIKKDLLGIIETIKKNWDTKFEVNDKSYFG